MTDIIGGGAGGATGIPDNTLSIVSGGQAVTGWQAIQVRAGCEHVPREFDITATDRYPGQPAVIFKPGDPCQVKIGTDTVITGYLDQVMPAITPQQHLIRIRGRGKCQDLVDCSALLPNMQISGTSTLGLAQALAQPYGITVRSIAGNGVAIPQFNVTLGETPYEIIERICRFSQMLAYEDSDGSLVLARAGSSKMASGIKEGINLQAGAASFSMNERFSIYQPALMSVASLSDIGSGNTAFAPVLDHGVPRFRQLVVVSEQFVQAQYVAVLRAQWEAVRRYGRSQSVRLTVDSWRDSAGALWTPNALVSIDSPTLHVSSATWVIGMVSFVRDQDRGTVADLELMPREAFTPEPSVLQLYDGQIVNAVAGGAGNTGPGATPNYEPRGPGLV